jgi:hypothetical protein
LEQKMSLKKLALAAGVSLAALTISTLGASAYVVCNHEGDCWHTDARVHLPGVTFEYHPDDWYFHRHWDADRERHWREWHEGRGYWRNGVWITL